MSVVTQQILEHVLSGSQMQPTIQSCNTVTDDPTSREDINLRWHSVHLRIYEMHEKYRLALWILLM